MKLDNGEFQLEQSKNFNLYYFKTKKFKTNLIIINIVYDLTSEYVTKISLLPFMLKKGSKNYQSFRIIQERLDELYGAILVVNVFKRGERQIVQFSIEVTNENYLAESIPLLVDAISLLAEILTNPLVENEGFKEDYVELEKEMLKHRLEGILDDKIRYAEFKTIQQMCQNEPYSLSEHGRLEDLAHLDTSNLYSFYKDWLQTAPIAIYFIGDFENNNLLNVFEQSFTFGERTIKELTPNITNVPVEEQKEVIEELNVSQSKLNLGIRTYTNIKDDDYISLLMLNAILGGFAHSKLFVNVRERASLAYYASSRLDSHKGIITIQSGIETKNYQQALDIILKQLDSLKKGEITNEELSLTKSVYSSQLVEILDKPRAFADFDYHSVLSGRRRNLKELIAGINNTSIEEIVNAAQKIKVDTIYLLKGKGE